MDLTMTNVWLGMLAIVSLIEFLMICAAGIFAYRMYRQAMAAIETVERAHIAPLRVRVDAMLDQVQTVVDQAKRAQESVSEVFRHVAGTGSAVAGAVKSKTWPIVGILQGLKSVAAVITNGGRERRDSPFGSM